MNSDDDKSLQLQIVEVRPEGPKWHQEARQQLRETGRWSRMVGGGAVTSSKDPSEYVHPHLK